MTSLAMRLLWILILLSIVKASNVSEENVSEEDQQAEINDKESIVNRKPTTYRPISLVQSNNPVQPRQLSDLARLNGANPEDLSFSETLRDVLNEGWMEFPFGAAKTKVPRQYIISSQCNMIVRLVDLRCNGDQFGLIVDEDYQHPTTTVHANGCNRRVLSKEDAWRDGTMSKGEWLLKGGREYLVEIGVVASPYGGGKGAIRFDEDCEKGQRSFIAGGKDKHFSGESWDNVSISTFFEPHTSNTFDGSTISKSRSPANNMQSAINKSRRSKSKNQYSNEDENDQTADDQEEDPLCLGYGGLFVVMEKVMAHESHSLCRQFNSISVLLSKEESLKKATLETLKKCVRKRQEVWIGGFKGENKRRDRSVMYLRKKKLRVEQPNPKDRLYVLCDSGPI